MTIETILVGVDGTEGGEAAVRYAAREAARTGAVVRLLHVAPELAATVVTETAYAPAGRDRRERMLLDAAEVVHEVLDDRSPDRVSVEVAFGGRVQRLLEAARRCDLVVLGDQHRSLVDRVVTGSVLAGVAARATVPVVRVPATGGPAAVHGRVVAVVKHLEEWEGVLDDAVALAAQRGARLTLLHAWEMPALYDDLIASHTYAHEWEERARDALGNLLDAHHDTVGGVPVDLAVVHAQPARAIVDASASADLVVLARRPLVARLGHLGGTGRAVLRESRCPVVVLPPAGLDHTEDVVLEAEGRLEPEAVGAVR